MSSESTPLLPCDALVVHVSYGAPSAPSTWRRLLQDATRLLWLAIPISLASSLAYLERMITVAQVGRLSPLELSAMSLAQTFFNITGLSLVTGIGSAMDTFCGQAFGAAQPSLLGIILQRGLLLSSLTALGPLLGWIGARPELLLLGQQPQLAAPAGQYVQLISPTLLLEAGTNCISSYLSCQGLVMPLTLVTLLVTAAVPGVNHLFIFVLGWRLPGAAAGRVLLAVLRLLTQIGVVIWHNRRQPPGAKPWSGFSREALDAWPAYLQVALPSTAMMCLEWWASEALTILAGWLPDADTAVAATGICFGLNAMVFFLVYGLGAAVSIRVSNELGAGNHAAARGAVAVALGGGQLVTLVLAGTLWLCPVFFARLFAADDTVVSTVVACIPWLALALVGDGISVVASGVIRGAGRQALGGWVNLATYWGMGLPLAAYAGLQRHWGAPGLWWAMACTRAVQAVVLVLVLVQLDWEHEVVRSWVLVRSQSSRVVSRQDSAVQPLLDGAGDGDILGLPSGGAEKVCATAAAADECPQQVSPGRGQTLDQ